MSSSSIAATVYVAVVDLIDLGGGDDVQRQEEQLNHVMGMGYSLIAIFHLYPELHSIIEKKEFYSCAIHNQAVLLSNRRIFGKFPSQYYGAHTADTLKVRCNGFNAILYVDSGRMLDVGYLMDFISNKYDTLLLTSTSLGDPGAVINSGSPRCSGLTATHSDGLISNFKINSLEGVDIRYLTFDMDCQNIESGIRFDKATAEEIEDFNNTRGALATKSKKGRLKQRLSGTFRSPLADTIRDSPEFSPPRHSSGGGGGISSYPDHSSSPYSSGLGTAGHSPGSDGSFGYTPGENSPIRITMPSSSSRGEEDSFQRNALSRSPSLKFNLSGDRCESSEAKITTKRVEAKFLNQGGPRAKSEELTLTDSEKLIILARRGAKAGKSRSLNLKKGAKQ